MASDLRDILNRMGVGVKNINGEYRSTYEILFDLSKEWSLLNDKEEQKKVEKSIVGEHPLKKTRGTSVVIFDKDNQQQDYQYMAKDLNGKYVIGYVLVEKQWYSSEDQWIYYIVSNEYNGRGICGGTEWSGFNKVIVDKNTIEPYTQLAEVKYDLSIGSRVRIDKKFYFFDDEAPDDNVMAIIEPGGEIPDLWK